MKLFSCLIIFLIFSSGCSKENDPRQQETDSVYLSEIPVVDENWIQNKIENRNGKILFVNFWATWCVPCVEEFPDLVRIYNEHKNSDFEFLSISVDLPSEIETKVKPFLNEQSAEFPVVVVEEKRSDEIINLINPEWSGAVPATVIYDEKGIRREFISEAKSFDAFHTSIERVKSL
jgi:thiol-disulfide isomerase/thioredoxin